MISGEAHTAETFSAKVDTGRWIESLVLAAVFFLVNAAGAIFQRQITYRDGKAWEGEFYYKVAEQFAQGKLPVVSEAPLVYRVGTPWLAGMLHRSLFPRDLFLCFKIVNVAANAVTLALLVAWLRRFINGWIIRTLLGLVFLLQWDTPTRWLYFYPIHVDPWMWVFLFAGLLAVERYRENPTAGRLALVAVLGMIGVVFREVVLVVPLAFLFVRNPVRDVASQGWLAALRAVRLPQRREFIPLVLTLATLLAVRGIARQSNGYSFAHTAIHFLYDKPFLVYLLGIFSAFGPMVWLPILYWKQSRDFLATRQHLAVFLGAFALLGFIGGTDTERLLYWSMPVVYVLIGRAIEEHSAELLRPWWLPASLAAAQLIASRAVFWPIPDHPSDEPYAWPVFTPFTSHAPFMQLYSFYDPHPRAFASLLEYLALGFLLMLWLKRKQFASYRRVSDHATGTK